MTTIDIDLGTFAAKHGATTERAELVFSGDADAAALMPLETFLHAAHDHAVASGYKQVFIDLHALSFMNSSCFTKIIGWVARVRDMPAESRYHIRIRSNQALLWQRRSLQGLQCFATDLISLEPAT